MRIPRASVVLLAVAFCGCHRVPPAPAAGPVAGAPEAKSGHLSVRVYFDATPSMAGFTAAQEGGMFARVLRKLYGGVDSEWPGAPGRLFRFGGGRPEELSRDREAPLRKEFYSQGRDFFDTSIDRAVNDADTSNLT